MTLEEFKKDIEEHRDKLLSGLDEKIERLEKRFIEKKFTGIEFEDFIFKFKID
ncbi:unnamed protein product [marine sediment metagenome]|uniref:Uncharacterized protein n=1 Tax=marine sediment metagenome TaxID=412755 RepID=X1T713_9ZZZZ